MSDEVKMGDIGSSGCPCGQYKTKNYTITAHCWRTGHCCSYSGVHYKAKKGHMPQAREHAKKIADYIGDAWSTEVTVTRRAYV